jgi:hypothetical protein
MEVTVITSMSKEYYDLVGKIFVSSYLDTWPHPLIIYTEDDLSISESQIEVRNILDCSNNIQEYLDYIGDHRSRGFTYKVFSWIHAAHNCNTEWLLWIDADCACIKEPDELLYTTLFPKKNIVSYMKTIMYKDKNGWKDKTNCDSAILSFNTRTTHSKTFINEFERLYTSKEIDDRRLYPKPNDTHAFVKCIQDAERAGYQSFNFNNNDQSLSPLKESVLGNYFRHFKANRKNKDKIKGLVDKLVSSSKKLKNSPETLAKRIERVERRYRNDMSK